MLRYLVVEAESPKRNSCVERHSSAGRLQGLVRAVIMVEWARRRPKPSVVCSVWWPRRVEDKLSGREIEVSLYREMGKELGS
jgi:hypothetical protein